MELTKILVVDDEARIRKLIRDFLSKEGYAVIEAEDGADALDKFYSEKGIALVLLDVMMPKLDGWSTLREIRENSKVPVIMLTALGEESDELKGFELGVDEYISKPFSPKILVARVAAVLRRSLGKQSQEKIVQNGIEIDREAHTVTVDGQIKELSFKEFELLLYLMENAGHVLSREKILNNVWNYDYFGDARTVDTHIKKIRSKLGEKGDSIKTIWGVGYRFETE